MNTELIQEARRQDVTVDGRHLSYLEWAHNDAPTVLLLHGFGTEAASWSEIGPELARDYRVLALDGRGHGHSDWHERGEYDWEEFVADLEAFHRALQLPSVLLVGHSMGGQHATPYAARNPADVAALVLEDIGPRPTEDVEATTANFLNTPLEFDTWEAGVAYMERAARLSAATLEGPEAAASPRIAAAVARRAEEAMVRQPDGRVQWRSDVAGLQRKRRHHDPLMAEGQWPEFERLICPTLVIRGGRSNVLRPEIAARMQDNPHVRLVEVADAGHTLHRENPSAFLAIVREFFVEVSPSESGPDGQ